MVDFIEIKKRNQKLYDLFPRCPFSGNQIIITSAEVLLNSLKLNATLMKKINKIK